MSKIIDKSCLFLTVLLYCFTLVASNYIDPDFINSESVHEFSYEINSDGIKGKNYLNSFNNSEIQIVKEKPENPLQKIKEFLPFSYINYTYIIEYPNKFRLFEREKILLKYSKVDIIYPFNFFW